MISVEGKIYGTVYFPYFRKEIHEDFSVFGMRLPSGKIEDVIIFHDIPYHEALSQWSKYLIKEYILEDDEMLTPKAQNFKADLEELFYEKG